MPDRRNVLRGLALAPLGLIGAAPARAGGKDIYAEAGVAMAGGDVVAYFSQGHYQPGRPDLGLRWRGVTWLFATQAHRERFEMNPRAFAPRFGGWCAYRMAWGERAAPDPRVFALHDGALYLLGDAGNLGLWSQEAPLLIARAEAHWQQGRAD